MLLFIYNFYTKMYMNTTSIFSFTKLLINIILGTQLKFCYIMEIIKKSSVMVKCLAKYDLFIDYIK